MSDDKVKLTVELDARAVIVLANPDTLRKTAVAPPTHNALGPLRRARAKKPRIVSHRARPVYDVRLRREQAKVLRPFAAEAGSVLADYDDEESRVDGALLQEAARDIGRALGIDEEDDATV